MFKKILGAVTVIIAVVIGIMAVALRPDQLSSVIIVSRFFEVMIPVLAVGALLRYMMYCPHTHTLNTVLSICFILVALILGVLAVSLPPEKISSVIVISRFFEVMLPIFAVGALIKFLTCSYKHCHTHTEEYKNK